MPIRIVVTGSHTPGRVTREQVWRALDFLHRVRVISELIEGGAECVDTWAGEWADAHGVKRTIVEAPWGRMGKKAGPWRNRRMAMMGPDGCVAFPGGPGTRNCVSTMGGYGVPVWRPLGYV